MSINNKYGWKLSPKDEEKSNIKNHYYILVNLLEYGKLPEYYIIPHNKLAKCIHNDYVGWLKSDKKHKDNTIRVFDPYRREKMKKFGEEYKNNWEILNLF